MRAANTDNFKGRQWWQQDAQKLEGHEVLQCAEGDPPGSGGASAGIPKPPGSACAPRIQNPPYLRIPHRPSVPQAQVKPRFPHHPGAPHIPSPGSLASLWVPKHGLSASPPELILLIFPIYFFKRVTSNSYSNLQVTKSFHNAILTTTL